VSGGASERGNGGAFRKLQHLRFDDIARNAIVIAIQACSVFFENERRRHGYCTRLPSTWEARRIATQLFDCGTSVGANYRAAGRARSDSEFIAEIGTVVEEADESKFWLELLKQSKIDDNPSRDAVAQEAAEIRAIFVASRKTAIQNRETRRKNQQLQLLLHRRVSNPELLQIGLVA
jgi:four helix bundle protein